MPYIKGQWVDFSLLYEHIFGVYIVAHSHAQTPAEAHFFVSINSMIFLKFACAKLQVVFCACRAIMLKFPLILKHAFLR